ncbi:MAG: cysteine peptidase family C39 domain-containing protein [Planctomycetota bacterium]
MSISGDWIIGSVSLFALSVFAYIAAIRWKMRGQADKRSLSGTIGGTLVFCVSLVVCLAFVRVAAGRLFWAEWFPHAGVLWIGNIAPVLLAWTAGLATAESALTPKGRLCAVSGLVFLTVGFVIVPVARPLIFPVVYDEPARWDDGICMQSHPSTCGAAASSTLLNLAGIRLNERSMVEACLTSSLGTEPLGIFRGLSIVTAGRNLRPAVVDEIPARWQSGDLPNIALVTLEKPRATKIDLVLGANREGHAIVVLGRTEDGQWLIGDPAVGRTIWTDEDFRSRFTGEAIALKQSRPTGASTHLDLW